jgi:hypothetical protein
LPETREDFHGSFVLILVWLAGPECVLIKLEVLIRNITKKHCPQTPITYRQGFDPFFSRTGISKDKWMVSAESEAGQEETAKKSQAGL